MPDTVAPSAPAAPAPSPSPAPAAPSPAPAPAAPASPAPAPTVENASTIADAWQRAVEPVPLEQGEPDEGQPLAEPVAEPDADAPPAEAAPAEAEPPVEGEEPVAQPEADEPTLDLSLEDTDFGPKELGEFLKKDAGVEKFFNDHPEVKNRVFAMARRDSETRAIREIAPTVEIAQEMQRGHALFSDIDGRFLNATTPEGFKGFMDFWLEQSVMVDDKGQWIKGEDGKYKTHPALTNVLQSIHANRNDFLTGEMTKSGQIPAALADSTLKVIDFLSKSADEGVQEAARIIKEAITPSSSAEGDLPAELKPYSERLDARAKALKDQEDAQARTQRESEKSARHQALFRADKKAAEACIGQVKPLLKNAGLSDYEAKHALSQIGDRIDAKLKEIKAYQIARDRLEDGNIDDAREKAISKLTLTYTQEIVGGIVRDVIREATQGKLARQTAKDERVAEQERTSRTDARGSSVSGSPSQPMTVAQMEDALVKEYKAQHNDEAPDRRWITENIWKKMGASAGAARRT